MKFEDLGDILAKEEKSTLSRLSPDFYSTAKEYIKELEEVDQNISRRRSEEGIMIQYELKNALSSIDKIFNRRIRKIIRMASGRAFSKAPTNIAHDIENMTPEEKQLYKQILDAILSGKKNTIEPILGTSSEIETGNEPDSKPGITPASRPDSIPEIGQDNKIQNEGTPETGIRPDIESDIGPDSKPGISTLEQDSDENIIKADSYIDEVSGAKPTDPTSHEVDQVPTGEKQDLQKVSAADNTHTTEKISQKSSAAGTETITPPITDEAAMGRDSDEKCKKDLNKEYIVVRLLKDIPKFRGADGRNYILYTQDVAVLPKVNAKPLIKRKVAAQIITSTLQ